MPHSSKAPVDKTWSSRGSGWSCVCSVAAYGGEAKDAKQLH